MGFPGGSLLRICLPMQEMQVQFLSQEDPLKKEMTTHSSILTWRNTMEQETVDYSPLGCRRVEHDLTTKQTAKKKSKIYLVNI